ncbi:hypothetical protein F5B21DRAFT_133136 [Xylaria acuta]|nr:hypothetical protein F5B21DRAFT_133136 [Xylaria acuta]
MIGSRVLILSPLPARPFAALPPTSPVHDSTLYLLHLVAQFDRNLNSPSAPTPLLKLTQQHSDSSVLSHFNSFPSCYLLTPLNQSFGASTRTHIPVPIVRRQKHLVPADECRPRQPNHPRAPTN